MPPLAGRTRPQDPAFSDIVFRQRERTVDNVKRVYAVVYSISFTYALRDILDFSQTRLSMAVGHATEAFDQGLQLRLFLLLIFLSTVAVFAYQGDKFLDLRYALRPKEEPKPGVDVMTRWSGSDLAVDAISLIATLVPFILMSYSFDNVLMTKVGLLPFFFAYLLLLSLSLLLLGLVRAKYLLGILWYGPPAPNGLAAQEEERYLILTVHWFLTNGGTIVALLVLFNFANAGNALCGLGMRPPESWFVVAFAAIALLRNYLDVAVVWPFLYFNEINPRGARDNVPWFARGVVAWVTKSGAMDRLSAVDAGVFALAAVVLLVVVEGARLVMPTMAACPP